jgi:hypothetical protein
MEYLMNNPETVQTFRRVVADFALGVFVFALVAGCVAISEGQASGGQFAKPEWVTTVAIGMRQPLFCSR